MQLFYDTLAVHDLGEFTISQSREYEGGGENTPAQRVKLTLRVAVDVFEDTFADNHGLLTQLVVALRKQQAVLRWVNDDTGQDYVNQTCALVSADLPEDPSAWGSWAQQLVFTVSCYEHNLTTQNMVLEFTPTGGSAAFSLGHVTAWREGSTVAHVSPLRSARSSADRQISVSGLVLGDMTLSLAARRTALMAKKVELDKLCEKASGLLRYGTTPDFLCDRTVRVTEFSCEVDQITCHLGYSFTARYTLFPDEASYALVDYTCDQRDGQTGEQFLAVTGVVGAPTEVLARAKLETLSAAMLTNYGYTAAQLLQDGSTAKKVAADVDGDTFIELNFTREWRRWRADNQAATFKKSGSLVAAVSLGEVRQWNMDYDAKRFSEMRSQRASATGRIEAAGTFKGDPALSLAARRAALLAAQLAMQNEVNTADGTLQYGVAGAAFNQVVRVDAFKAEINQAITAIEWTLAATWSRFPNEAGYATAEFNVGTRANVEDGDEQLSFAGRILAQNRAAATVKLDALRASVIALYGYTAAQRLTQEISAQNVGANGDVTAGAPADADWSVASGVTFLELTFNETYRRRSASLLSWNLTISVKDDTASGLIGTTYSGTVTASGASADAAYTAAALKANALAGGKEAGTYPTGNLIGANGFLKSRSINWTTRNTNEAAAGNSVEFVRLDFSYEYQAKLTGNRAYLEVAVASSKDSFGADMESVSGSVVAVDFAAAEAFYQAHVRSGYNARLLHGERKTQSRVVAQTGVNTAAAQEVRLEFSFEAFLLKATGAAGIRYAVSVGMDYLSLEMTTRVSGSVTAASRAAADTALATLAVAGGTLVRSDRNEDKEWTEASGLTGFLKLDFDDVYVSRITGDAGVIEMRLTESVSHSGSRLVVQPTLKASDGSGGFSVVQDLSVQEGSRSIRGSVSAASLAVAQAWAKARRTMLTGAYVQPEQWETDYEFVPRISGVVSGVGANVKVHRVSFTFSEILPNAPAPV